MKKVEMSHLNKNILKFSTFLMLFFFKFFSSFAHYLDAFARHVTRVTDVNMAEDEVENSTQWYVRSIII